MASGAWPAARKSVRPSRLVSTPARQKAAREAADAARAAVSGEGMSSASSRAWFVVWPRCWESVTTIV
jgi:hypothetical protein